MKKILFIVSILLFTIGTARADIFTPWIQGISSFFSDYTNIAIALALSVVTMAVAKKAFGSRYGGGDNKIPIAIGIAVFIFSMIYFPQTPVSGYVNGILYTPGTGGIGVLGGLNLGTLPGLIISIIFVIAVFWAWKNGKFENKTHWLVFVGMLAATLMAFIFSYFRIYVLSGAAGLAAVLLFIAFLILFIRNIAMSGVNWSKAGIGRSKGGEDSIEKGDGKRVMRRNLRNMSKLDKNIVKIINIKDQKLIPTLKSLASLMEFAKKGVLPVKVTGDVMSDLKKLNLLYLGTTRIFKIFSEEKRSRYAATSVVLKRIAFKRGNTRKQMKEGFSALERLLDSKNVDSKTKEYLRAIRNIMIGGGIKLNVTFSVEGGSPRVEEKSIINFLNDKRIKKKVAIFPIDEGGLSNLRAIWHNVANMVGFKQHEEELRFHLDAVQSKVDLSKFGVTSEGLKKIAAKRPTGKPESDLMRSVVALFALKTNYYGMIAYPFHSSLYKYRNNLVTLIKLINETKKARKIAKKYNKEIPDSTQMEQAIVKMVVQEGLYLADIFSIFSTLFNDGELNGLSVQMRQGMNRLYQRSFSGEPLGRDELFTSLKGFGLFRRKFREMSFKEVRKMGSPRRYRDTAYYTLFKKIEEGSKRKLESQAQILDQIAEELKANPGVKSTPNVQGKWDNLIGQINREEQLMLKLNEVLKHFKETDKKEEYLLRKMLGAIEKIEEPIKEYFEEEEKTEEEEKKIEEKEEKIVHKIDESFAILNKSMPDVKNLTSLTSYYLWQAENYRKGYSNFLKNAREIGKLVGKTFMKGNKVKPGISEELKKAINEAFNAFNNYLETQKTVSKKKSEFGNGLRQLVETGLDPDELKEISKIVKRKEKDGSKTTKIIISIQKLAERTRKEDALGKKIKSIVDRQFHSLPHAKLMENVKEANWTNIMKMRDLRKALKEELKSK